MFDCLCLVSNVKAVYEYILIITTRNLIKKQQLANQATNSKTTTNNRDKKSSDSKKTCQQYSAYEHGRDFTGPTRIHGGKYIMTGSMVSQFEVTRGKGARILLMVMCGFRQRGPTLTMFSLLFF